ncbi:MAG: hypothetical protein K1X78_00645 [Verrucomicrobiaceae bacterium]|nr:hypothetical protein [Verrucomicrobiaceae bacterium]
MNHRSHPFRVLSSLAPLLLGASSLSAEVPRAQQKDFVTSHNSVRMTWNPQGYWVSKPGAFIGNGSTKEVCDVYTRSALSLGKIPKGYRFQVSTTGQFVVCDRPLDQLATARPAAPPPASKPLPSVPPPPAPAPAAATEPASPPPSFPNADSIPVRRAAIVDDTPSLAQARGADASPMPSARRTAVLDPVHATAPAGGPPDSFQVPSPSSLPIPPPPDSRPEVNGVPGSMQTSFLSKHKSVFMTYDKKAGKWHSSEGAIKDDATADEWCKEATVADRLARHIPGSFSYKHVGGGQVEVTRD